MKKLDLVINELKNLADGEVSNIPLPDDSLLNEYEKQIGFKFTDDYRQVLKSISNVFYGTIDLLSVTKEKKYPSELSVVLPEAHAIGVPEDWLPICEDNGDYYCLINDGSVKYWSHNGLTDENWPDLASWIEEVWIGGN